MDDKVKRVVENVFKTFEQERINYAVLRGWDGETITGSDIDIITQQKEYPKMENIFSKLGFLSTSRGAFHIDLFAEEKYFDKSVKNHNIRFHVTDRLVFGKPARRIRFPVENNIFLKKDNKNKYSRINTQHEKLVHIIRMLVDKPKQLRQSSYVEYEDMIRKLELSKEMMTTVKKLVGLYSTVVLEKTHPIIAKYKAIHLLKQIPGSEYYRRFPQYIVTKPMIVFHQTFIKPHL